jgi:hypothetical protein
MVKESKAERELKEFLLVWLIGFGLFASALSSLPSNLSLGLGAILGFLCGVNRQRNVALRQVTSPLWLVCAVVTFRLVFCL